MADTRKLTMVFNLDHGDELKYNLTDPTAALTKTEVDEAMQAMIDNNAVLKDGHGAASIKEAYITTTTQTVLE